MKHQVKRFSQYVNENSAANNIVRFELDLDEMDTPDFNWLDFMADFINNFNLEIVGLDPRGPGGGSAAVTFRGTQADAKHAMDWYFELTGEGPSDNYDDMFGSDQLSQFKPGTSYKNGPHTPYDFSKKSWDNDEDSNY